MQISKETEIVLNDYFKLSNDLKIYKEIYGLSISDNRIWTDNSKEFTETQYKVVEKLKEIKNELDEYLLSEFPIRNEYFDVETIEGNLIRVKINEIKKPMHPVLKKQEFEYLIFVEL